MAMAARRPSSSAISRSACSKRRSDDAAMSAMAPRVRPRAVIGTTMAERKPSRRRKALYSPSGANDDSSGSEMSR
jgi:hypothetical protein